MFPAQITLTVNNAAELAALAGALSIVGNERAASKDPAPAPTKPTAAARPAAAPAEKAQPSPEAAEKTAAPAKLAYDDLRAAVFALAKKSAEAAVEINKAFGVKTMKDLAEDRWPEALAAVKAKLAELELA